MKTQNFNSAEYLKFLLSLCCVILALTNSTGAFASASSTTADSQASPEARAVQAFLAALTDNNIQGVIAGQNAGHSDDIANSSGLSGFALLIGELENQTSEAPGIMGVDYEHNKIATPEQLQRVNHYLIDHWRKGGLVTINWSPQNPWWNDESDLEKNSGIWTNTRSTGGDMRTVDLTELVKPHSPMQKIWHKKLDRIAAALNELQNAGVVVLWRPMQEMNGNWFWWGSDTSPKNAEAYVAIWRDMFAYFTQEKKLHNLLWVFSPNQSPSIFERSIIKPALYNYPGDQYVDIVAGTAYNDELNIKDYETYLQLGKPIGIAEFGPRAGNSLSRTGALDTQIYAQQLLKKYPSIAYWVSWSSWSNGDGTQENQALIHNKNVKKLLQNPEIITRSRITWRRYLKSENH